MADIEKVIEGLEDSLTNQSCGYMDGIGELYAVSGEYLQNAIALLKKHLPMEPKEMKIAKCHYQCAVCGSYVGIKGLTVNRFNKKYCSECGQAVKWE